MNIEIHSRERVVLRKKTPKTVIISVTDPCSSFANIDTSYYTDCLLLKFGDTELGDEQYPAISEEQAALVRSFVESVKDKAECIVVNCDAGISRSSGMAAAIALYLNGSDREIFDNPRYSPNMMVYRLVLNSLMGVTRSSNTALHKHELLDRSYLILDMFNSYVSEHAAIPNYPELVSMAEGVSDALYGFYNKVAELTTDEES